MMLISMMVGLLIVLEISPSFVIVKEYQQVKAVYLYLWWRSKRIEVIIWHI
jgi:hypothetical protein